MRLHCLGLGLCPVLLSLMSQGIRHLGSNRYHEAMQQAVFDGDASILELIASNSGADAATVVCYLHPGYDGEQPGICTAFIRPISSDMCYRWLPHYVLPRLNSHN